MRGSARRWGKALWSGPWRAGSPGRCSAAATGLRAPRSAPLRAGALGAGAGYLVARNNATRSHSESDYNAAISEAQKDADAYRRSADLSRSIAAQCASEIDRLDSQYRSRQISAAEFRAKVAHYQETNKTLRSQIEGAQNTSNSLRTLGAPGQLGSPGQRHRGADRRVACGIVQQRGPDQPVAGARSTGGMTMLRFAVPLTALALLAGCAPGSCDPSQAGFLSGIGCEASGAYTTRHNAQVASLAESRAAALQGQADAGQAQDQATSAQMALGERQRRLRQINSQNAVLSRRLSALRATNGADQGQLGRAQAQLAELNRRSAVTPATASAADLRDVEQKQRELADILAKM